MDCTVLAAVIVLSIASSVAPPAASADLASDRQALLDFASGTDHSRSLNWMDSTPVCTNWTGVGCRPDGSRVAAVRLPGASLSGALPPAALSRLTALEVLSLRSNNLSGRLPLDFSPWKNLTVLDLSSNGFTGGLPPSLSGLARLTSLDLSNNSLSGGLPDLRLPELRFLDLSNNRLTGSVPAPLLKFPRSSFSGNQLAPVLPSIPSLPSENPRLAKKLGEPAIFGIAAAGGFAALLVALYVFVVLRRRKKEGGGFVSGKAARKASSSYSRCSERAVGGSGDDERNRLVFFDGCSFVFDLEDLLRASAEVLGKGTFGTAYRALLEDATTVVVKRLKEVGVGRREFEQQMEAVGRVRHENVAELRAYYYSKDERLMVYDFYARGSVSALLHGKRGEDRNPLDWETRVKIALGAARGVAHIHNENGGKLVHGNIKSSNVFLNTQGFGCVSDLGLSSLSANPVVPGSRGPPATELPKSSTPAERRRLPTSTASACSCSSSSRASPPSRSRAAATRWCIW
ncbi:putative inactive receptor kinase isoform X1 [Iris pallida]|uniref:Inactive receptor kinase isoform X1 n=1 Tax=Iris pallida TaxID=29817 RepID=A0AAX6HYB3_IRIPA|nr:putative inactive receptor kinase isoform X1 [Iris pallida]